MMLFNMTLRNVQRNFKNYWAYFLSSSFSVFVLYLFMSILYSKNIREQLGGMGKFLTLFNVGAVMIILFSAFFIWYSNSFFIKSREKEFATYMLLGMSKNQVSKLNFLENIIIMLLSLFTGIALGLVFTKFFIMLLFFMIKVSAATSFQWNIKALKVTLSVFLIIFIIITLHGSMLIRHSSLLQLFNASKKLEKGLKVSFFTFIFSAAAVAFIAYGYYTAVEKLPSNFLKAPLVVFLVVAGTILFFSSTTSLIIHLNKKNEKSLFKGTKLISTAQLYYRYKGNVGTLSMIAVTTTIALCALVTCIGSYSKTEENSRYMRPMSIEYINNNNADAIFQNVLKNHKEVSIKYKDNIELLKTSIVDPLIKAREDFYIIKESEFDRVNLHENIARKANLKSDNDCYFLQMQNFVSDTTALGMKLAVNLAGKTYNLNITGTDIKPYIALDHLKETLVVKDTVFNDMLQNKDEVINIKGYMLNNDFNSGNFAAELNKKLSKDSSVLTFYDHYKDGLKLLGMMAFIGLFIGLLFLTATGSIIYFKMAMEAREDKDKFVTLSKIGVSRKEIKTAVSKELLLLFGLPFLLAAANTFPATKALSIMLSLQLMKSYVIIIIIYAVIYCIYYFVTLNSYMKNIIE